MTNATGSGRTVGASRSPRVLVVGLSEEDEDLGDIEASFPTTRRLPNKANAAFDLREQEWDAVVSVGSSFANMTATPQICFAELGDSFAVVQYPPSSDNFGGSSLVGFRPLSIGRELCVPHDLQGPIEQAVMADLLPRIAGSERRPCLASFAHHGPVRAGDAAVTPFLTDADGCVLAGIVHHENRADVWFLPRLSDHARWIRLAFDAWARSDPLHYSLLDSWRELPKWMTVGERQAKENVEKLDQDWRAAEQLYLQQSSEAREEHVRQTSAAEQGLKRLLRSQDDDLVDAVNSSLTFLGFTVELMDVKNAPKGAKLEDLRVSIEGDHAWVALAEVRGYKGGAKTDDLIRIGGFVKRMLIEEQRPPSACWYIVNQFINDAPDSRAKAFEARPSELTAFAEEAGSVIDTRDLFRLHRDVEAGEITSGEALTLLRENVGLFIY